MREPNKLLLYCLLIIDLVIFGFICWLYPILWAPDEPEVEEFDEELYVIHYMILDYGQWIPVYELKEHDL